jgi:hypothetical protein
MGLRDGEWLVTPPAHARLGFRERDKNVNFAELGDPACRLEFRRALCAFRDDFGAAALRCQTLHLGVTPLQ